MSIKEVRHRIFKQENVSLAWGRFKALVSSCSGYASWISLGMQSAVLYTVLTPYMQARNIEIAFWQFALLLIVLAVGLMLFEWKVTIPSMVKFNNEQAYKWENPIRTDLEKIKEQNQKIMDKLGIC